MTFPIRTLFLVDALGAGISALSLGVVIPLLNNYFGMPFLILYLLAFVACALFVFSFFNYLFRQQNQSHNLKRVAFANLTYCFLTAVILLFYFRDLTVLARVYFIGEVAVILLLVRMELKAVK